MDRTVSVRTNLKKYINLAARRRFGPEGKHDDQPRLRILVLAQQGNLLP